MVSREDEPTWSREGNASWIRGDTDQCTGRTRAGIWGQGAWEERATQKRSRALHRPPFESLLSASLHVCRHGSNPARLSKNDFAAKISYRESGRQMLPIVYTEQGSSEFLLATVEKPL